MRRRVHARPCLVPIIIFLVATTLAQSPPPVSFATGADQLEGNAATGHAQVVNDQDRVRINEVYGKLPLSFEANRGQTGKQVKFLSRGNGYSLFLTSREAVLVLSKSDAQQPSREARLTGMGTLHSPSSATDVVRLQLVGVNQRPEVVGEDQLPGTSNYFIGKEPSKWRSNIPNFSRVRYRDVYPGIDLVYYGNQRHLEHDFVLSPGADPSRINFTLRGVKTLKIDETGNLLMRTPVGELRLLAPRIHQDINGIRTEVAAQKGGVAQHRVNHQRSTSIICRNLKSYRVIAC